jgi:hypothetical protein
MRTRTLHTTKILAVALTTLAGCAATPVAATDPSAEPIRAEAPPVATTEAPAPAATAAPATAAAPAPMPAAFSPPCDDSGYPLVGNTMSKGPSQPPAAVRVAARDRSRR